jgi:hypothetical protein
VAHLIVSVVNCNEGPVGNATVTVGGSHAPLVYFGIGGPPDPTATATEDQFGAALITDLPAGLVTIRASHGSTQFLDNTVLVTPGAVTIAEISP